MASTSCLSLLSLQSDDCRNGPNNFELANVFYWEPQRRYRFVQVLLESVPKDDQPQLVRRLLRDAVAGGGRLIVPIYGLGDAAKPEVARGVLEEMGFTVAGSTACVFGFSGMDRPPCIAHVLDKTQSKGTMTGRI